MVIGYIAAQHADRHCFIRCERQNGVRAKRRRYAREATLSWLDAYSCVRAAEKAVVERRGAVFRGVEYSPGY